MKNALFSNVFTLISLLAGSQAFALECGGLNLKFVAGNGQLFCSKEEAAFNDRNRANMFTGSTVVVMPAQRQPIYVQHQPTIVNTMPQGYGYRDCTVGETVQRAALISVGGGLAGLLLRDNGQAAGQGAGLGLLYSMGTDCRVAVPQGTQQVLVNQGQMVTSQGRICPAGTTWRVLDWLGHPNHGKELCLPPEATIEAQKAEVKGQTVASTGRICQAGTTWRMLDWPGHPKHGQEACLPSAATIEAQKAAFQKGS